MRKHLLLLVALAPLLLIYARFAVVEPIRDWAADDLAINYSAATLLRAGGFIYDAQALRATHEAHIGPAGDLYSALFLTYNNTPITVLLFWPLSFLPFHTAQAVFVVVNNTCYLGALALVLWRLRAPPAAVIVAVCGSVLVFFYPVRQSFGLGQMNGVLTGLLALALAATLSRHDARAGALIALAASLKISPILLLVFFVARRRWRAWLGACAAGGVLLMMMLLTAGPDAIAHFVGSILPAVGRGSAAYPNQSLLGAIYRFMVPAPAMSSSLAMGDYPFARLIWLGLAILLCGALLWLVAHARLNSDSTTAVAFSSFIVAGLLVGSLAWDHYALWLIVPLTAVIVDWFHDRWLNALVFWPMLCVSWFAIGLPVPFQAALYNSLGPAGSSVSTWGMLLLLCLMGWRLQNTTRAGYGLIAGRQSVAL